MRLCTDGFVLQTFGFVLQTFTSLIVKKPPLGRTIAFDSILPYDVYRD